MYYKNRGSKVEDILCTILSKISYSLFYFGRYHIRTCFCKLNGAKVNSIFKYLCLILVRLLQTKKVFSSKMKSGKYVWNFVSAPPTKTTILPIDMGLVEFANIFFFKYLKTKYLCIRLEVGFFKSVTKLCLTNRLTATWTTIFIQYVWCKKNITYTSVW